MHPATPEPRIIAQAADAIDKGGVIVCPTQGLYGLAADAFNANAVQRVYRIKGRAQDKPLLVLISDTDDVKRVAQPPSPVAHYLMNAFWPGKVTFVLSARQGLAAGLTAGGNTIGIRQTAHPVAADLVKAVGRPLTGTSANISGAGGCARVSDIDPSLIEAVDLVLDCGPLAGGQGSTIVDISGRQPVILRQGAVKGQEILDCHKQFKAQDIDK